MKRQGSLLLVLTLMVALLPLSAFAQDLPITKGGNPVEETCVHEKTEVFCTPAGDWIHTVTEQCICTEETDRYTESCYDEEEDGFCDFCEAELPCLHENTELVYERGRKEKTHFALVLCDCGEEVDAVMETCRDRNNDGRCDGCKARLKEQEPAALGDVNEDGTITNEDAKYILRYVVQAVDDIEESLADVDGDGMITAMDATSILRYCAGLIAAFPAEN